MKEDHSAGVREKATYQFADLTSLGAATRAINHGLIESGVDVRSSEMTFPKPDETRISFSDSQNERLLSLTSNHTKHTLDVEYGSPGKAIRLKPIVEQAVRAGTLIQPTSRAM